MSLKRYVVTRNLPGVDSFSNDQLKEAAQTSNKALVELKGEVQWVNSFVVADKTYCIYQAKVDLRFLGPACTDRTVWFMEHRIASTERMPLIMERIVLKKLNVSIEGQLKTKLDLDT